MRNSQPSEHALEIPLPEAVGLPTGVRRERRHDGPAPESLLERSQVNYSCQKIARHCRRLRRQSEGKRVARDLWNVIPGPVELRCQGVPDATARIERLRKGEWSIYFGREDGFDLDLISPRRKRGQDSFLRITHLQAGMIEGGQHYLLDGHITMIPEVGEEDTFREYFGIPADELHPSHRFSFSDDPAFAAEAVREALGHARRPR